jgi:beta-galactosidase
VRDGDQVVASASTGLTPTWVDGRAAGALTVTDLQHLRLWDLDDPVLYTVVVRLLRGDEVLDETSVRTGLRDARFTDDGLQLNGRRVTLRGLNRHQTYPHVGAAMPARIQRWDAEVLRHDLKCNSGVSPVLADATT